MGTWLGGGAAVAPHLQKFMSNALRLRVFHAEERDRQLGIVTNGPPGGDSGLALIQEQFRAQSITVTPASSLRHLLVGLADHNARLLGLGLIEAIDFRRQEIGILTAIRAHAAVKLIHFGLLRVDATGKELGAIRPGDV
jgi:polynucleotide 5'-kinase involved in rRNA processing